MFSSLTEHVM